MYDYETLESVERNFGSVAEYNRVMEEEYEWDPEVGTYVKRQYIEPTEEELAKEAKEHRIHERKIEVLSGTPSDFAVKLKKELDAIAPKRESYPSGSNEYYYDCRKYSSESTLRIVDEVNAHYGIDLSRDVSPYRLSEGEFAVSIEYHDYGRIYHYSVRDLTYGQFKAIFRDLKYLGKNPTMFLGREGEYNTLILSNSSLGSLRYYDFVHYGYETYADMDAEALAVNKAEYEAHKDKVRLYDRKCNPSLFKHCAYHHYIGQISEDDTTEYAYCEKGLTCTYDESPLVLGGAA